MVTAATNESIAKGTRPILKQLYGCVYVLPQGRQSHAAHLRKSDNAEGEGKGYEVGHQKYI